MVGIGEPPTNAIQQIYNSNITSGSVCLKMGDTYLWVDATGDVRVSVTNPSSDTDGQVVGGQS